MKRIRKKGALMPCMLLFNMAQRSVSGHDVWIFGCENPGENGKTG